MAIASLIHVKRHLKSDSCLSYPQQQQQSYESIMPFSVDFDPTKVMHVNESHAFFKCDHCSLRYSELGNFLVTSSICFREMKSI